nr:hypothetical protein [Tanacetum cinerariifolium]
MEKSFNQGRMIVYMNEDVEVAQAKAYNFDLQHAKKVLSMHDIDEEEPAEVEEVLKVVKAAKLITKSKDKGKGILIEEPKTLKDQAQIDIDEALTRQMEAELNANINWNDIIEQVKRCEKQNNEVMRYQALKRKPMTESQARKNMMIYLKNMVGFKMNFFKDLEALWKLVKERFEATELKNFSDDFLLNILKIMFDKPNVKASVWRIRRANMG